MLQTLRRRAVPCLPAAATTALAILSSCASTLPAPESTAFHTLATADKGAFDDVVAGEAQVGLLRSQRLLSANEGRVLLSDCGRAAVKDCTVTYSVAGTDYKLVGSAPNMRALLGAIDRYADAMAELCEAKDLDTVKSKADGAAGAVKALTALVPVPGVSAIAGAIIDAATFAGNQHLRDKRRNALLKVALAARPAVAATSRIVSDQATALKESVLAGGSENILATQATILQGQADERQILMGQPLDQAKLTPAERARIDTLHASRAVALDQLVQQSQQIALARKLGADWGKLNDAHEKLIAKLQDPKASLEDAMTDIDAVLALLDGIKGAKKTEG